MGEGVLHVTGWEEAFGGANIAERIYDLNFLRESIVEHLTTQIWWMPVAFRDAFMTLAPDTWSVVKLKMFLASEAEYLELSPTIAERVRFYLRLPPSAPIPRKAAEELAFMDADFDRLDDSDVWSLTRLKGIWNLDLIGTSIPTLKPLAELPRLTELNLHELDVPSWRPLSLFKGLEALDLVQTNIKDLSPLSTLHRLRYLDLMGTKVRNLKPLAHLESLAYLDVSGTDVADVSVLRTAKSLSILNIRSTPANSKGVYSLYDALPDLLILR